MMHTIQTIGVPALILVGALACAGGATWLAWGRRPTRSPEDRAYAALARRLRLSDEERALVERLALSHRSEERRVGKECS